MHAGDGGEGWVGSWAPGIGDPTPMGWATVGAYLLAAGLCGAAGARARARGDRSGQLFWLALAGLYFALGINKQLDLQSLVTELGRINAVAWGWVEHKRIVQAVFIGLVSLVGAGGLAALLWTAPWRSRARTLALVGTTFLVVFVVVRAASFHKIDALIGTTWLGLRANWLLELPGILVTAAAGGWSARGAGSGAVPERRGTTEPGQPEQRGS